VNVPHGQWPCGTFTLQARSLPSCQCIALITKRLEETSRAPEYHLTEGIDADVQSANIGIHSAWRKANDRVLWQRVINTATLHYGHATEESQTSVLLCLSDCESKSTTPVTTRYLLTNHTVVTQMMQKNRQLSSRQIK